jgi:hypothetical protein
VRVQVKGTSGSLHIHQVISVLFNLALPQLVEQRFVLILDLIQLCLNLCWPE